MSLWIPSPARAKDSHAFAFSRKIEKKYSYPISDFHDLYKWSVTNPEAFWSSVWEFAQIIHSKTYSKVLDNPCAMPGAKWFLDARLNFAENLLRVKNNNPAIIFWGEDKVRAQITFSELEKKVSQVASSLRKLGLKSGDRVAACMPNMPETVIAMLATTSIGAIWSSCSPDFGVQGIVDRFGQIEPKILFSCDGYYFKGKAIDVHSKILEVVEQIPSLEKVIEITYAGPQSTPPTSITASAKFLSFQSLLKNDAGSFVFEQLPFDHPLYIMFSSGTTGKPKCIVHSAGGVLLEHLKEHLLHCDLRKDDRIFYQTTCGWMMWNWLVSALATGATLVLYDGSPFHLNNTILWKLAEEEKISIFGTNPKYLSALEKEGLCPEADFKLKSLTTILSTGSPLLPQNFNFVYENIKKDICLSSISGGTDILGCFALGSVTIPVHLGEIQTRSLGLNVQVFDQSGQSIERQKGELVCTSPFPSMPLGFWNDQDQSKYRAAYFQRFPAVWHHGDYVELTENQGMVFYGRSDAVLNPGGIRIGTAEIYRQVEQISQIAESLVIAQQWKDDVRVVLFVKLSGDLTLTEQLKDLIRQQIRTQTSPFHVPKKIIQVPDIPRTISGKIVELAVRDIVHGITPKNLEALANPGALEFFKNVAELKTE